jgi:hypothetical protein
MNLSTMRYFEPAPGSVAEKQTGYEDMAWTEVTKGLLTVLAGYILSLVNAVASIGLVWIATDGFKVPVARVTGDPFTVLLIGGTILFFSSLYCSFLVLRGKWRCMINAPEQRSAKWLMFASMLCVCAGPILNFSAGFIGGTSARPLPDDLRMRSGAARAAVQYAAQYRQNDLSAYMRLAGSVISPLGPIFFVLFIRAVHGCLGSFLAARFTELYLLFLGLLIAGTLSLILDPRVRIQVDLLLCLGIGWLVAAVWYFLLVLGAAFGISAHINAPRAPARA